MGWIFEESEIHSHQTYRLWSGGPGGTVSPEIRWPVCGADHSLAYSVEILRHGVILNQAES
jgi:hypothetical protein